MDEEDFELLEIEDQAAEIGKLTPREYAKIRFMQPQLVYYHLRRGNLKLELCVCGRKVIDVKETDAFFERMRGDKRGLTLDGS